VAQPTTDSSDKRTGVDIVTKKSSDEPLTAPTRLRLPLNIRAGEISLSKLTIVAASGSETQFTDLAGNLNSNAHQHEVNLAGLTTPWGKGSGQLSLGNEQPFPLAGSVSFQGELGHAFTANATLSGVIAAIGLTIDVQTHGGKASLQTQVTPFVRMPLQTVRLQAQQVDLHDLSSAWPFTQLSAQIDGKVNDDSSVSAAVSVQNALFGPVDQNRLPLRSLQGRLIGKIEAWRLEAVQLDLGSQDSSPALAE
jgi:translocation and assembly module TamB